MMQWNILWALLFMILGGLIVHVAWVHSWHMYKNGKAEGQGLAQRPQNGRVR